MKLKSKILLCLVICISVTEGYGKKKAPKALYTNFTNPLLSGMKPGMVYSLKKEAGLPFIVGNGSSQKLDILVYIDKQFKGSLREGYEQIPDFSWIKVIPSKFKLNPGEKMECEIIISIPEGEEYENRSFSCRLVTQSIRPPGSTKGIVINLALASIVRFSTGKTPANIMSEYRERIMESLKIEMAPFSLNVSDIPTGRKIKLDGYDYSTVQIINRGKKNYRIKLKSVETEKIERYGVTSGYEPAPDSNWLSFEKEIIKSKKKSLKDVTLVLDIPDKEEYKGRNFAFVVTGKIDDFDIPIEIFSRIYVKTRK